MNVYDWVEKTKPNNAGTTKAEAAKLRKIRARVLKKANTTMNALSVAKARGVMGSSLFLRMKDATKKEPEGFQITANVDDFGSLIYDKKANLLKQINGLEACEQ